MEVANEEASEHERHLRDMELIRLAKEKEAKEKKRKKKKEKKLAKDKVAEIIREADNKIWQKKEEEERKEKEKEEAERLEVEEEETLIIAKVCPLFSPPLLSLLSYLSMPFTSIKIWQYQRQ